MRLAQIRRTAIFALSAGAILSSSACFGSFNLTRKLYAFNKDVSKDKFVRELVFLGLNIVPVYGIAGFVDAVVVNTVEFWTGTNPVDMSSTVRVDSTTVVKRVGIVKNGERIMTLSTFKDNKLVATTTMSLKPNANYMTFETELARGPTEIRVVAFNANGSTAVVSSTLKANLQGTAVAAQH